MAWDRQLALFVTMGFMLSLCPLLREIFSKTQLQSKETLFASSMGPISCMYVPIEGYLTSSISYAIFVVHGNAISLSTETTTP